MLLLLSHFSHVWSPPGSPVFGILQARTLEWVAISFSNAGKWKVKVKSLSRARLLATPLTTAYQAPPSMGFSRQEYWTGVPSPSPDAKNWLTAKGPDAGKDWRQEEKGMTEDEMVGRHNPLNGHEFAQTHVHWIDDAIQPSHLLSSPSPWALNLSEHQALFQWVGSSSGGQSIGASVLAWGLPINF